MPNRAISAISASAATTIGTTTTTGSNTTATHQQQQAAALSPLGLRARGVVAAATFPPSAFALGESSSHALTSVSVAPSSSNFDSSTTPSPPATAPSIFHSLSCGPSSSSTTTSSSSSSSPPPSAFPRPKPRVSRSHGKLPYDSADLITPRSHAFDSSSNSTSKPSTISSSPMMNWLLSPISSSSSSVSARSTMFTTSRGLLFLLSVSIFLNISALIALILYSPLFYGAPNCHDGISSLSPSAAAVAARPSRTSFITFLSGSNRAVGAGAGDAGDAASSDECEQERANLQLEIESWRSKYLTTLQRVNGDKKDNNNDCPTVTPAECSPAATLTTTSITCTSFAHVTLPNDDLSFTTSAFDPTTHELQWDYCDISGGAQVSADLMLKWCAETSIVEQPYQLQFFDRPGAGSKSLPHKGKPRLLDCVHLPPLNYRWPAKYPLLPVPEGADGVHWPNLRVQSKDDLLVFNPGTPKNLYHFNASFYDREQDTILTKLAKYIPFGPKIRLFLDIGSGGASLGLLVKQKYDVQTVSTVFADWPYCEYITERGGICMLLDAMEAFPFAKFSFDVVHSSWVFHALFNDQLRREFLEQHRVLRPGGYMWIMGGWSYAQVETLETLLIHQLGYKALMDEKRPTKARGVKFDTVTFELEWHALLLKPIAAVCGDKPRAVSAGGTGN